MRKETLTAYGEASDRDRLIVLSKRLGITASSWIIQQIREEYLRLYGDADPEILRKNG